MGREDELFDKYMLIRQMTEAVRNKNMAATGPLGDTTRGRAASSPCSSKRTA